MINDGIIASSFRDPSGFVFYKNNEIYRQVNKVYQKDYDLFIESGLYDALIEESLVVPHEEEAGAAEVSGSVYKIIKPEPIPFISYPYEWCFSQFKDAALTTLNVQKKALEYGMSLKDCSAYNIQFTNGKPIFIDTLSFEAYKEGFPWVAYRQFCQHFLAPLALMALKDVRLNQLLKGYIDGIPLDLVSHLLPSSTYLKYSVLIHIHLHAKSQKHFEDKPTSKTVETKRRKISKHAFLGLIDSLETGIRTLKYKFQETEWGEYYDNTNYSQEAFEHKKLLVGEFTDKVNPRLVWDLGANEGVFSRIVSEKNIPTLAFDIDPVAVEKNYLTSVKNKETFILPLLLDLTNPSPGIGWENKERMSLVERSNADLVVALALIHHLAIGNNLPLGKIAKFFSCISPNLIIEFVPKSDSQVKRMLSTRKDIFGSYDQNGFEQVFFKYFSLLSSENIKNTTRTLYLLKRKG